MVNRTPFAIAVAGVVATALTLTGCSSGAVSDRSEDGRVRVVISNLPTEQNPESRKALLNKVDAFEKANPDIDIEPTEYVYEQSTFAAQLSGGTLPTMFNVSFIQSPGLIEREQVRPITAQYEADTDLEAVNANLLKAAKDPQGALYGLTGAASSNGLLINRALFTKAGLDPDVALTSWGEVAAAAKAITEKTDAAGFGMPTTGEQGGWILAGMASVNGGTVEVQGADEKYVASLSDNAGLTTSLQWLKDARWKDNSLGSNYLINAAELWPAFAAGDYGIIPWGPGAYQNLVVNMGMKPEDVGALPVPQTAGSKGVQTGGTYRMFRPDATDDQVAAGIKWFKFDSLNKFFDPEAARTDAAAASKDGQPVPNPAGPAVNQEVYDAYLKSIEQYINVDLTHFEPYFADYATTKTVGEPPVEAKQMYALLDTTVQAVLTREDADVATLLADAQSKADRFLADAQS